MASRARKEPKVSKAKKVIPERLDPLAHKALSARRASRGVKVSKAFQEKPARKVTKEKPEKKANLSLIAILQPNNSNNCAAPKVRQVLPVQPAPKETPAQWVRKVSKVPQENKAFKVSADRRAPRVSREFKGPKARRANEDFRAKLVLKAHRAYRAKKVRMVPTAFLLLYP